MQASMVDCSINTMELKLDQIVQDVVHFKDAITSKVKELQDGKLALLADLRRQLDLVNEEKGRLMEEQQAWAAEKERIQKI